MEKIADFLINSGDAFENTKIAGSTEFNNLKNALKAYLKSSLDDYKGLELDNDNTHIQKFNKKSLKEKTNILKDFSNIEDHVEYALRDILQ